MSASNSSMSGKAVKQDGHLLGIIKGDTFYKRVSRQKHMLRNPRPSWALSREAFHDQVLPNATFMEYTDKDSGRKYKCQTVDFARLSFEIHHPPYEPQLALDVNRWELDDPRGRQLLLALECGHV